MANSLATLKREKSISTLAKRLFVIEGPNQAEALRMAETALLRANPRLADPEAFRPGQVVIVPADTGLKTTERVEKPAGGLSGALNDAKLQFQLASQMLDDDIETSKKGAEKTLEQLSNRQFLTKLRKAVPESRETITNTKKNIQKELEKSQNLKSQYSKAFERAQSELERLMALAKRTG